MNYSAILSIHGRAIRFQYFNIHYFYMCIGGGGGILHFAFFFLMLTVKRRQEMSAETWLMTCSKSQSKDLLQGSFWRFKMHLTSILAEWSSVVTKVVQLCVTKTAAMTNSISCGRWVSCEIELQKKATKCLNCFVKPLFLRPTILYVKSCCFLPVWYGEWL